MNNTELDKVLNKAKVPEPRPGFWDDLPANVQREINRLDPSPSCEKPARPNIGLFLRKAALPLAFATACIVFGFVLGANSRSTKSLQATELAEARKLWREVAGLFPNQLEAIVFDQQGSHVVLSERADQPIASPIYLKLCDGKQCNRFITFSGQQIKVNGESFEVLIDRNGAVLLVGDAKIWNSARQAGEFGAYKVFAKPLADS